MRTGNLLLILIFGTVILVSIAEAIFKPAVLGILMPFLVIIFFSPLGRSLARKFSNSENIINTSFNTSSSEISRKEFDELKANYNNLENKLKEYDEEIAKLRESVIFYEGKKLNTNKTLSNQGGINLNKIEDQQIEKNI